MANITQAKNTLYDITGISNVATSSKKAFGMNIGTLFRKVKGNSNYNALITQLSGISSTLPFADDYKENLIYSTNSLTLSGYCGQYYDFNGNDTKIDMYLSQSPASMAERFNGANVISCGFNIRNDNSAFKQNLIMGSGNYPIRVSINTTTNLLEVRALLNGISAETLILGEIPALEWSENLVVLDIPNQTVNHYQNGVLVSGAWHANWADTADGSWFCLDHDVIRFGGHMGDVEMFNGACAGYFITPEAVTPTQAEEFWYRPEMVTKNPLGLYVSCDESYPTNVGSGTWAIADDSATVSGYLISASEVGTIFAIGWLSSDIPQRMISVDEENVLDFRNQLGYCLFNTTPNAGQPNDDLTIATWIKPYSEPSVASYIFRVTNGTDFIFGSYIGSTNQVGLSASVDSVAYNTVTPVSAVPEDEWTHIAANVDRDGTMKIYVNGEIQGTPVDVSATAAEDFSAYSAWSIGTQKIYSTYKNSLRHKGFTVINGPMSQDQIKGIANLTRPRGVDYVN